ncbi:MAG: hypothetical protein IGR76_02140 [Synechococcales cyanobacterium T60_A2020_003]|nr:hypothetical protein [Synechococcales cyanobacterium T60_A2020_003]
MNIKMLLSGASSLTLMMASAALGSSTALANPQIAQEPASEAEVTEMDASSTADTSDPVLSEPTETIAEDTTEAAAEDPAEETTDAADAAVSDDISLFERPSYIDQCRSSGATLLTVYKDSSLTLPFDDIEPYTQITLTGVLGEGVAQLEEPLGWVRAATLLLNCDAGPNP